MIDSLSVAIAQHAPARVQRTVPLRRMAALAACCRPSRVVAGLRALRARSPPGRRRLLRVRRPRGVRAPSPRRPHPARPGWTSP